MWYSSDSTGVAQDTLPGSVAEWQTQRTQKSPPMSSVEKFTPDSTQSRLRSCQCTQAQLSSSNFQGWAASMHEPAMHMHRKVWEYSFIAQALFERGMLCSPMRGLGFAVGQEPLSALFANLGCEILATDLAPDNARTKAWSKSSQHADTLHNLNLRGICSPELFEQRVQFRFVDMRHLPDDLGVFDFLWSCCSLEHLGNLKLGENFIYESQKYLRPGGVAVHTTEYNLSSNFFTPSRGYNVIYRKRDFERIAKKLRQQGCVVELDFRRGNQPLDQHVDKPPYSGTDHLTLLSQGYVATSFGLIIEKKAHF